MKILDGESTSFGFFIGRMSVDFIYLAASSC